LSISIIIPVLNEEVSIGPCLDSIARDAVIEIIVVDGGSVDKTIPEAQKRKVKIMTSAPGRGTQQHAGAKIARGDTLLFLHCDTRLPRNFAQTIEKILHQKTVAAGAFRLAIDATGAGYRLVEWGVNIRSRLCKLPYGDQALFLSRERYFSVGGFPEEPIMEDVALVCQLKKTGAIALADSAVITSARRWKKHGILHTMLINQFMLAGRMMGIPAARLARWYSAKKSP